MYSPSRREKAKDEPEPDSHLPKGNCRYILLHPEVKGLRCACVGFALNRSIPGSTCDCGHQACYHVADKETATVDSRELDALKEKVNMLEDELDRERQSGRGGLVDRLGRLEELVDRTKADNEVDLKGVYRGLEGLWRNVGQLTNRGRYYDDHIEGLIDDVQRIQNRLIEVDDAAMGVEDRVEALEKLTCFTSARGRRRKASTPPSMQPNISPKSPVKREEIVGPLQLISTDDLSLIQPFNEEAATVEHAWTVHISLLPTSSQPFPFEKDTAAYKRCLSRGLHRVIAIPDTDSHSFTTAVSDAFADILRGRHWMPLVARICDAKNLRGLPMLRQLPERLIGSVYDVEFLKNNCAVLDDSGKIMDLYISMLDFTLSWSELRRSPPFLKGLEGCWQYDPYLDGPCLETDSGDSDGDGQGNGLSDRRPAAGDIVPNWSPSSTRLKRAVSEISRTPSFGSSAEGEGSRAKLRRQCTGANVEVVGRRAEAV